MSKETKPAADPCNVSGVELAELDALVNAIESLLGAKILLMETEGVIGEWNVLCADGERARLGTGVTPRAALEDALDTARICR